MKPPKPPLLKRVDSPRNVNRVTPLYSVGPHERKTFAICAPRPFGFATHWDPIEGRTRPCQAAMGKCEGCGNPKVTTRDKAVVLVANAAGQKFGFLELTPQAFRKLLDLSSGLTGIRGLMIEVYRKGGTKRGQLMIEPVGRYQHTTPLPQDEDPMPTLLRIFGLDKPD